MEAVVAKKRTRAQAAKDVAALDAIAVALNEPLRNVKRSELAIWDSKLVERIGELIAETGR